MQKQWLKHFCKYRHICEFLGNEGKEKEEIKEYLMQELGLPEATARYQMMRALEDEVGSCRYFEKTEKTMDLVIDLQRRLKEREWM